MVSTALDNDRAREAVDTAEAMLLEQHSLALSFNDIADRMGVSRSLLYVYFNGMPAICDVIFCRHLDRLSQRIDPILESDRPFDERFCDAFADYLDYVVEAGPVVQLLLRERHDDSPLGAKSQMRFRQFLRRVATLVAQALELQPREAFVFLELNAAIPEALARLVRAGEIEPATAERNCRRLVAASLDAFALRTPA